MRGHSILIAWIVSVALLVGGALLQVLFPRLFIITFYCSAYACPTQVSGGLSIGYVVIVLGLVAALLAGIMSGVNLARHRA